ncbi:hypothetical protein Tco_0821069 [Tanacetum coccineum]|uniref:Uncharacterized protein n=1 Tax=Tanacetum coccineum TaxID=301880 RepID=A0ABQ5AB87_9ASTR
MSFRLPYSNKRESGIELYIGLWLTPLRYTAFFSDGWLKNWCADTLSDSRSSNGTPWFTTWKKPRVSAAWTMDLTTWSWLGPSSSDRSMVMFSSDTVAFCLLMRWLKESELFIGEALRASEKRDWCFSVF